MIYYPTLLADAVDLGYDTLFMERCPFCKKSHHIDTGGRKPDGGILYVEAQCSGRNAFDREGVFRKKHAVRILP